MRKIKIAVKVVQSEVNVYLLASEAEVGRGVGKGSESGLIEGGTAGQSRAVSRRLGQ